jgi:hypothetical protein
MRDYGRNRLKNRKFAIVLSEGIMSQWRNDRRGTFVLRILVATSFAPQFSTLGVIGSKELM